MAKTEMGLTAEPGTVGDEPDHRGASSGDLESVLERVVKDR